MPIYNCSTRQAAALIKAQNRGFDMFPSTLRTIPRNVSEVLSYNNERLLRRYEVDHKVSSKEASRYFQALKEFLIVCAVKPGPKVTSDPIDEMWHTFLLFTKDYKQFCEEYLGRFIDHEPFEDASPNVYKETRDFARNYFGSIDIDLWPVTAKTDCSSGCGE